MLSVLLAAGLAAAAPAKPAAAGPPIVIQTASVDKLLSAYRFTAKTVAGDDAAKSLDDAIKQKFGDKGLAGLDTKKPIVAYMVSLEGFEDLGGDAKNPEAAMEALKKFKAVIAVPYTTADEFKTFFATFAEKVKLEDLGGGLFKVDNPTDPAPIPIRLRMVDGYAYFGVGLTDEMMAEKALTPAGAVIDAKDTALVTFTGNNDRIAPDYYEKSMKNLDKQMEQFKEIAGGNLPSYAVKAFESYMVLAKKWMAAAKDMAVGSARLTLDETTAEIGLVYDITPKKGSQLAADLAGRKATTNKFAGLIGPESAVGGKLQLPFFAQELRDMATEGLKAAEGKLDEVPPPVQPLVKELIKGLTKTVATGEVDFAMSVNGPDKDGHFTGIAALAYEGGADLEKELKAFLKDAPEPVKKAVTLDVEKVGDVAIHKIVPPEEAPEQLQKVLGATAIYVAFGPKGVYAAIGMNAVPTIKAALAAKPGEAKVLDVTVNPRRVRQLAGAADENAGRMVEAVLGTDDKTVSALSLNVTGGEKLTIKLALNLKILPRAGAMAGAMR